MHHIYLNYIAPASVVVPLIIGLRHYQKLIIGHRYLIAMLTFSALSTILGRIFAYVYHNNLIIMQSYTVSEFLFFAGFYYYQFNSKTMRRTITAMVTLFTIFAIYLIVIYINVIRFDDYAPSIESLLIFFLSVALINKGNQASLKTSVWNQDPNNWFNTGILLYFSGSLFIFLLSNYITNPHSILYRVVWDVQVTFLVILSALFTKGFSLIAKKVINDFV
jgi:hypothetical protein